MTANLQPTGLVLPAEIDERLLSVESSGGPVKLSLDQTIDSVKTLSRGLKVVDRFFSDDFERADAVGSLGIATTGQTWAYSGAAPSITSGRYVNDGNTYANITHSEQPLRMGGKFSYVAGGGGATTPSMMIACALSNGAGLLNDMVHCRFDRLGARVSLWTSATSTPTAFAATTAYVAGQVVSNGGNRYAARVAFTSGASFVATDWTLLGAITATDSPMLSGDASTAGITFSTPLVAGTEYEIQMSIIGDQVHVEVWTADGLTFLGAMDCSDPRVRAVAGTTTIWQITTTSNASSAYVYRWSETNAVRRQPTKLEAEVDAPGGLAGPIGAKYLSAGYFKRIGIGTQAPTCPLDVVHAVAGATAGRFVARNTTSTVLVRAEGAAQIARLQLEVEGATNPAEFRSEGAAGGNACILTGNVVRVRFPSGGLLELNTRIKVIDAALFQTTVGAAGAASAPPATPTKWFKIYDEAFGSLVIPCYAAV